MPIEDEKQLHALARAAKILSIKWTTNGQKIDGDDFFEAIEDVHRAVCALYGVDIRKGFTMQATE